MERFFDNLNTPKVVVVVALFFVVVNGFLLHRYQQQFDASSDYQAVESPDSDGSPTPFNVLSVRPSGATGPPVSLAISSFKPTRSTPAETGAQEEAGGGGTGASGSAGTGVVGTQGVPGVLEPEVTPAPALAPTVADGRWAAAEVVGWAYEVTWGWTTGVFYTFWGWLAPDYQDDGATVSGAAYPADDSAATSSAAYPADDSATSVPDVAPAEETPEGGAITGTTNTQEDTVGTGSEPSTPGSGQAKQQPGGEQTQQQLCAEQPKQQAGGQKKQQSCKEQPKQQPNDKQQQDAGKQQQDLEQQQNDKQQPK